MRFFSEHSVLDEVAVGCIGVLLLALLYQVTVSFTDIRYTLSASEEVHEQTDNMFFSFDSVDPTMMVTFRVREGFSLRPSWFTVRADDCLGGLTINGQQVSEDVIGPCVIDTPKEMHLGPYFRAGLNEVTAIVPDTGGRQGFSIRTSSTDLLFLSVRIAVVTIFTLLALLILFRRVRSREGRWFGLLFLVGVLIRLVYFDATPYDVRSNDAEGHMDYIQYVFHHWRIPATEDGWEFYHPPLYYFLLAPLYGVVHALDLSYFTATRLVQFFSVLLSIGTLGICVRIGDLLFEKHRTVERCLWLSILAVFPGMLLLSPVINNDALVQFFSFLAVALSLQFWQSGGTHRWILLVLTLALGMLTKMNMIVLLPVAFLTLLLRPDLGIRKKFVFALLGVLLILSLTEWLLVLRVVQDSATNIVGNLGNLNDSLKLTNNASDYVTFNPWQVLRHPFGNPWEDSARRMNFLEYLFRSSFFGELDLGSRLRFFSQSLLTLGLSLGLLCLVGITKVREHYRKSFPLWLTFFFVLFGHACFRYFSPYSSSEHFRYSAVLLVPLTYFTLLSLPRTGQVRAIIVNALWCFILFSISFIIILSVLNPT